MKLQGSHIRLSATDLANHLSCRHLTSLDLLAARGEVAGPEWADPSTAVLQELGREHEAAYLEHLRQRGLSIAAPEPTDGDSEGAFTRTVDAMRSGSDVIYQPTLQFDSWFGRADVLLRVETPSDLGAWSYEAVDCKLARNTRAGTILQLSVYSRCVEKIQGKRPEHMYVLTPGTKFEPTKFRTADYFAYHDFVAGRLIETVSRDVSQTYPEPTPHCDVCRWWHTCNDRRRLDDHPSFVAGISKSQIRQLQEWQVTTLAGLAEMPVPFSRRPRVGSAEGLVRVREQARLQLQARQTGKPEYELLPLEEGRGLALLPEPSPGDVFLDLEGDRFAGESGIEYLFGIAFSEKGGVDYRSRWAFNAEDERSGFEWTIDRIAERLEGFPGAHVYHFGHYEPTALKRLMGQYATREDAVDRLLRAEKFVDVHSVVRQSLRAGIEGYSLKQLEQFHGFERETPLREASASKRAIERALELAVPQRIDKSMMDAVESYNRDDCVSALSLRDWLETLRAGRIARGDEVSRPEPKSDAPSDSLGERQQAVQTLVVALTRDVPADTAERSHEQHARWLLAHLLDYHWREDKADWWEFYRLCALDDEEYLDEHNAVYGLEFLDDVGGTDACPIHRYHFPPQEIGFREGKTRLGIGHSLDDYMEIGKVESIDSVTRLLDIKKTNASRAIHPTSAFVDPRLILRDPKPAALLSFAQWVVDHGIELNGAHRAARDLLLRNPPRISGSLTYFDFQQENGNTASTAIQIARLLEPGIFPIQGPPGAGKTFTGSQMICELVRAGKKVGVTGFSHKVITNLLRGVVEAANERGLDLRCSQRVSEIEEGAPPQLGQTDNRSFPLAALIAADVQVGAGTSWVWAHPDYEDSVDVLFVDEAGQMPLADVLAVSRAAKSVVLLGDPAQLEQPQQGSHPPGVAVSALQHLLGDHQTLPPEAGIFLPDTWRLHPRICEFTSEIFYEGRLKSRKDLKHQALTGTTPFAGSGLWFVPVEHEANQNASEEEVAAVERIVHCLLDERVEWVNSKQERRPLTWDQILVVAPYNAQVCDIQERLPQARVGTVDKFQGQQAAVVIYSMATSSPEDAPRGMEFLYNLNRLNVATSRARCASILVASHRLLEPECRTPREMQLANALCHYAALATTVRLEDIPIASRARAASGPA